MLAATGSGGGAHEMANKSLDPERVTFKDFEKDYEAQMQEMRRLIDSTHAKEEEEERDGKGRKKTVEISEKHENVFEEHTFRVGGGHDTRYSA